VVLGCLLGMTSLLFMDLDKNERLKKQRELRTLFATLMEAGYRLTRTRTRTRTRTLSLTLTLTLTLALTLARALARARTRARTRTRTL
jgi:hypothetical protein